MAAASDNHHPAPLGYSIRGAARHLGIGRELVTSAIALGELRASKLSTKRTLILEPDLIAWVRMHTVRPQPFSEAVVEAVLARENRSRAI